MSNFQGEIDDPLEIVELGTTEKSLIDLNKWIKEKIESSEFTASAYKLLENNCICFANAMSEFLCGKPIDNKYFETQERFNSVVPSADTVDMAKSFLCMSSSADESEQTESPLNDSSSRLERARSFFGRFGSLSQLLQFSNDAIEVGSEAEDETDKWSNEEFEKINWKLHFDS